MSSKSQTSNSSTGESSNNNAKSEVVKRTGFAAENPAISIENSGPKKKRKRNRQDKVKAKASKRVKSVEGGGNQKRINDRKYSEELIEYLHEWNNKEKGVVNSWKFNKRLQYWAIDNCFDDKCIDDSLFDGLIAYYASIQGSIKSQFVETCTKLIQKYESLGEKERNENDKNRSDSDSDSDSDDGVEDKPDEAQSTDKKGVNNNSNSNNNSSSGGRDLAARDLIMLNPSSVAYSRAQQILAALQN